MPPKTVAPDSVKPVAPEAHSVSGLTRYIQTRLQKDEKLQNIWVEGEVLNFTHHSSGHMYFSLKDPQASIRCTFFRHANQRQKGLKLSEGVQLLVLGSISLYPPHGSYQLNVTRVMLAGEGEIRLRIEQLKQKLYKEGLFAPERKRELPFLPVTIGVASAPTGAAFRDIVQVARNRFPGVNILLAPCQVQGEGAIDSIVTAIEALNQPEWEVDVIIAGRGGGSFEDLLAFNEEAVVRAYAASQVPIISAVGHEIDNPLSDLIADAFAPTPSAAAEMATPVQEALVEQVNACNLRLRSALKNKHATAKERLTRIFKSRVHQNPASLLEPFQQGLDLTQRDMRQALRTKTQQSGTQLRKFDSLPMLFAKNHTAFKNRFSLAAERLQNFSPLGTLARGFAVVRDANKQVVRKSSEVKPGDELELLLGEGKVAAKVERVLE